MVALDIDMAFDRVISGRRLLEHRYYRAWQHGLLTLEDLGAYAEQYRYVERCLPGVLAAAIEGLDDVTVQRLIGENLHDEQSQPKPHAELFETFAGAVGAKEDADATKATRDLVALYDRAASSNAVAVLSVIGTYELQAAEVAATKAESLRGHYGLSTDQTEFWDVHAALEQTHAEWTIEALRLLDASPAMVEEYARESAQAWWGFLDERDAIRSSPCRA